MRTNLMSNASMIALGARMTPSERSINRFLRAPEGHDDNAPGGASFAGGGGITPNNAEEKPAGTGTVESGANNAGQQFDPKAFWEEPEPVAPKPDASGKPAGAESKPDANGNQGDALAQAIQAQVSSFAAPEVMTAEAIEGIGKGEYGKFNENLNKAHQAAIEAGVRTNIKLMGAMAEQIFARVDQMIQGSHTKKDDRSALREAIPSSKNAAVAPIIDSIYDRALTLAKGDRTKAIQMTKSMLASMASETGKDVDLSVAPIGADSDLPVGGAGPKVNWLEALNQPG